MQVNIKSSWVISALAIPIMIISASWYYVNEQSGLNKTCDDNSFAKAGQFGDKFGMANAMLSGLSAFLLLLNYLILKEQLNRDGIERRKRSDEAAISELLAANYKLKEMIKLFDVNKSEVTPNQIPIDFLAHDNLKIIRSYMIFDALSGLDQIEYLRKCVNEKWIGDISDIERYLNTANEIGILLSSRPGMIDESVKIKIMSNFSRVELLYLGLVPFRKGHEGLVGLQKLLKITIDNNVMDFGGDKIVEVYKTLKV